MVGKGRRRIKGRFIISCSVDHMLPTIFSLYMFLLCSSLLYCSASYRDNITINNWISDEKGEIIVSAGERFVLGFFTPDGSSYNARYVGIWYHNFTQTVVWIANRDRPLLDNTGVVAIKDGNLQVLDRGGTSYWSANLESPSFKNTAKLMDSGNLVLIDDLLVTILWESFRNPTDTFLPGMKMDETLQLTSWKSRDDPGTSNFTFQRDQGVGQFIIRKRSIRYWRSGESGKFISFDQMPNAIADLLSNVSKPRCSRKKANLPWVCSPPLNYSNTRLVMNFTGEIQYLRWDDYKKKWSLIWSEPRDRCSMFEACGNLGICNSNNGLMCKCLPGFEPSSPARWNSRDFSGGCRRKSQICGENDTFVSLKMMKVGSPDTPFKATNETDCRKECLGNCKCQAYSYAAENNTQRRGSTTTTAVCWIWTEDLSNLQEEYADGGRNLFARVAFSDLVSEGGYPKQSEGDGLPSPRKQISLSLIIAITSTTVLVLIALSCTVVYYLYLRRRRVAERQENIQPNQALHVYGSERRIKDLIDSDQFREEDKKGIDVPFFDLESILTATNNFSDANKLGQGGFGPVYKGKFLGGQEIAVKRLSRVSGQGLVEFKNEVVLIAKLQHRNLVRLLGYCVKGEEKMLLYEYMPNKSLDAFIFDQTRCAVLDWELRFNIILGIARGLLYLHQDSRLRIIHRDLKTSNILLDEEMNPKISDFGLARIFGGKQTEASTNRVVGTYGYMSPEYALDGFFSVKSDVFSFGVVVLEIISGKRNTRFYQSEQALSLLGYAWRLWNEDKALDLMDETLCETCNKNEFLKCASVGLLCVQEDPSDRPTMSNVVVMLGSETATLPTPKQPAFIVQRGPSTTASSSSKLEIWSNNELTATGEEGR